MKRTIVTILFIWVCFILQTTLFKAISFNGISPNLLIILTASCGFMRGEKNGIWIGFFCGLLCDVFYGDVIGFYSLLMMYIGYLNGKFSDGFYPEDIKLPMALIIVSNFTYSIICYICQFLLRGRMDFGFYFLHIILPEAVYTTIVTLALYPLILFVDTRLIKKPKRGASKFV